MNKGKKLASIVLSLFLIVINCTSCLSLLFTPVYKGDIFKSYTLTESDVRDAKLFLSEAEKATLGSPINVFQMNDAWNKFISKYYFVAEQANVAYVLYAYDKSNANYKENYLYASTSYTDIYSGYIATLRRIYNSSSRETFFGSWSQEDINNILKKDEEVASLELANDKLLIELDELSDAEFNNGSVEIYKKTIENNIKIATKFGYDNYYEYADKETYLRDFSIEQKQEYKKLVSKYMVDLYKKNKEEYTSGVNALNAEEKNTLRKILYTSFNSDEITYFNDYVISYGDEDMISSLTHAFNNNNVLFSQKEECLQSAFTVYMPYSGRPFCYFGSDYSDSFTVAHEIGHYYADLNMGLVNACLDLLETHSQSNEVLFLEYLSTVLPQNVFDVLESYKLQNFYASILVGAIIDDFEYLVYNSKSVKDFTSADFDGLMTTVCENYGGREFIEKNITDINKYWRKTVIRQPMYYFSYSTSAVASVGLYATAILDRETARENYRTLVEETNVEKGFVSCITASGYLNPFEEDFYLSIEDALSQEKTNDESKLKEVA